MPPDRVYILLRDIQGIREKGYSLILNYGSEGLSLRRVLDGSVGYITIFNKLRNSETSSDLSSRQCTPKKIGPKISIVG